MTRGFFCTFEGGDGSGKSTLARLLLEKLSQKNCRALLTREPGGTPFAEQVRKLFLEGGFHLSSRTELLAVLAARSDHVAKVIEPALDCGDVVLCDRFLDSTIVYQGYAAHQDPELVMKIATQAVPLIPDLTFLLDIDVQSSEPRRKKRGGGERDKMEQQERDFHERTRVGFLELAQKTPERIVILDATYSEEILFQRAWEVLEPLLLKKGLLHD